jgi:lysophospholipase L1-like esterase
VKQIILLLLGLLVTSAHASVPTTAPANPKPHEPAIKIRDGKQDERFLNAHAKFLERIKQGPIGVLFVGDSITAGWIRHKELLAKTSTPLEVANFGISGDRTQHVLWRLQNGELDITPPPKVVVLMIGTNNVRRDEPADIAKGIEAIIKLIREKLPTTKVLLLGVLPMGVDPADPKVAVDREKVTKLNAILKTFAKDPDLVFHDMGAKFLAAAGKTSDAMRADGVHLEPRGYEIWAESITPIIAEMTK